MAIGKYELNPAQVLASILGVRLPQALLMRGARQNPRWRSGGPQADMPYYREMRYHIARMDASDGMDAFRTKPRQQPWLREARRWRLLEPAKGPVSRDSRFIYFKVTPRGKAWLQRERQRDAAEMEARQEKLFAARPLFRPNPKHVAYRCKNPQGDAPGVGGHSRE